MCSFGPVTQTRGKADEIVRLRKRYLPLVVLFGVFVATVPTIASSETGASISAYDEPGGYGYHSWQPSTATVGAGGVVKFSNPYNEVPHGLKFTGGPAGATPSCTGIPAAAGESSGATNWQGECTFSTPGTYTFICTVHPTEMTGTITVNANGTTTTTTTTTTPSSTPGGTTTTTTPGGSSPAATSGSPLAGGATTAVKLAGRQNGKSVHGTVAVSQAGAGGRLEVVLLASGASLARVGGRPSRVRVGRFVRSGLRAGVVSFVVPLSGPARSVLRRHRRLALTVEIVLTPAHGAAVTVTRSVVEHS
jgi:plastocyanin